MSWTLTVSRSDEDLFAALRAGASGYVLKSAPSEDIARAIEVVAGGGTFVGTELGQGAGEVEKLLELTPREREVLELMAEGRSNQAIAERMFVTLRAVEKHVTSIFTKLSLPATAEDHRRVLAVLAFLR